MNKTKFFSSLLAVALFATAGVVTSCKDYDDDIKNLQNQIDAKSTKADLEALKTSLEGQLATAKSQLETALAAKANASDLANKADKSDLDNKADKSDLDSKADKTDLDAKILEVKGLITNLETRIKAIEDGLDAYAKKDWTNTQLEILKAALTGDIANLERAYKAADDALESKLSAADATEKAAREAADENLQLQITTLKNFVELMAGVEGVSDLVADVKALQERLANYDVTKQDVASLKEWMTKAREDVDKLGVNLGNLEVLVNKILNSISLVPDLYVGGIEAIEFKSLVYKEVVKGTSGNTYVTGAKDIIVSNGETTATYRLNPATVPFNTLDSANINYVAAIAQTRSVSSECPVAFNGVKSFKDGLMTVKLKKNPDYKYYGESLNTPNSNLCKDVTGNRIWIVALNVPRKADEATGQEAANIYSENSRLVETAIRPRIAHINTFEDATLNTTLKDQQDKDYRIHHFTDSTTMWQTNVDEGRMVYDSISYDKPFDVRALVTGCYNNERPDAATRPYTDFVLANENEITKDQLAAYGLAFRFAIPTTEYKQDADHSTDQQQFASIDAQTGILTSKLPDGTINNRACVGKEPIIRIALVDTVNNKLVDERYMKIKWVEETLEPVALKPYNDVTTLDPCKLNVSKGVTWKWFINEVYAKIGDIGLSQTSFAQMYPTYKYSAVTWDAADADDEAVRLLSGKDTPDQPVVATTTNEEGDALIAGWDLTPAQIARIYPAQQKTFKCTITFKSLLPTQYPDLTMEYTWTIKLPALPELNGYFNDYWFTKYTDVDIYPVQYNTAMYNDIKNGTVVPQGGKLETYNKANNLNGSGMDYCVFYHNMMADFTFEKVNNVPTFVVKGIYNPYNNVPVGYNTIGANCATWDMQFTKAAKDVNETVTYTQYNNYAPNYTQTKSPLTEKGTAWESFGAYRFDSLATPHIQALQLVWNKGTAGGHTSWDNDINYNTAYLYADHNNVANQNLLNPLSDENEPDGIVPKRTHNKPVHMGIWATLNDWNVIPIKDYNFYLVEPLRINANLQGAFEEGWISGTAVGTATAFAMTDFRGYTVAQVDGTTERTKYATALWDYYEVKAAVLDVTTARFGMKQDGTNVVVDNNLTYDTSMTAAQLKAATNNTVDISLTLETGSDGEQYIVFKNNGGTNVEEDFNVFIPATVEYGFGKVTKYCKATVYRAGHAPAGSVHALP